MNNKEWQENATNILGSIREENQMRAIVDAGWQWLQSHGERVYSEKGVSYTSDSIIKALREAAKEALK